MDKARAVIVGHLALATPAITAIVLVPFFCLRMFGPFLFVYYVLAGITFGWQWYLSCTSRPEKMATQKGDSGRRRRSILHIELVSIGQWKLRSARLHSTRRLLRCAAFISVHGCLAAGSFG